MSFLRRFFLPAVLALCVTSAAFAAPSLDITKGPVLPVPSWTGPPQDPHAKAGQWFLSMDGTEEVRTHEFYDNIPGYGGGGAGSLAISGFVRNVQMSATANSIIGFDIVATITNDTPGKGMWRDGTNSHGEHLAVDDQYRGTLYDTKLTAEFAVDTPSLTNWLAAMPGMVPGDPYTLVDPLIVAVQPDQLAWYCWSPDNPEDLMPNGGYLVPTYDFGDIAPGQSATRTLSFKVGSGGLLPGDPRYDVIMSDADVFLNRTTSLKVSNWIDILSIDPGTPYPGDTGELVGYLNSDVSVFHSVPEPATLVLAMISLGMALVLRRRD